MSSITHLANCVRCGQPLTDASIDGLCDSCAKLAGGETMTQSALAEAPTILSSSGAPAVSDASDAGLEQAQQFGPYRIGRLLGRGGMGEVYEAEHAEDGRRLAIKILRGRLRLADDRARFLREGQLAASVSHPHTVYIFGSEEIDGRPVISMELLTGGTLKDRVTERGPMTVHDAVGAVLEIIGGLDAAHAVGILHRDIKPSNCFTDSDGTVKVGDFGLSISTLARDVRQDISESGFQGTPQFAPPEQLRGEPLDVRADIYAVGATLFYLLTGRAPFEARELRELFALVTDAPRPSPRTYRPDIPAGLAQVVTACLAKAPEHRPPSYAALADRLRPYARPADRPAPLPLRLMAGVVDSLILGLPASLWKAWQGTAPTSQGWDASIDGWTWAASLLYFGLVEATTGASLGKRLLRLRVRSGPHAPTWSQWARRIAVYHTPQLVFALPVLIFGQARTVEYLNTHPLVAVASSLSTLALLAILFSTVRRSNGWAALHDLASGTRVVTRNAVPHGRTRTDRSPAAAGLPLPAARRYGPFDVTATLGHTDEGTLLAGLDPVLRRRVWIHVVAPETPAVAHARRDMNRIGRLHWLAGRRSPHEHWDAYEAPDGASWLETTASDSAWATTRGWLLDLATELVAAEQDGTMPPLSTDRLWVRADGHLMLLDVPAPGAPRSSDTLSSVQLLESVGRPTIGASPTSGSVSLPLSARQLIERWRLTPAMPLAEAYQALVMASQAPASVERWRRAIPSALAGFPILLLASAAVFVVPMLLGAMTPERLEMQMLLGSIGAPTPNARFRDPAIRTAAERYVATVHRPTLVDASYWEQPAIRGNFSRLRPLAVDLHARHAPASAEELIELRRILEPEIRAARTRYDEAVRPGLQRSGFIVIGIMATLSMAFVFVLSLVAATFAKGGLATRMLGLAVVTTDGQEISRSRSVARVLLVWSPLIVWLLVLGTSPVTALSATDWHIAPLVWIALIVGVMALGAALTIWHPSAGPHDRALRCRVVPR